MLNEIFTFEIFEFSTDGPSVDHRWPPMEKPPRKLISPHRWPLVVHRWPPMDFPGLSVRASTPKVRYSKVWKNHFHFHLQLYYYWSTTDILKYLSKFSHFVENLPRTLSLEEKLSCYPPFVIYFDHGPILLVFRERRRSSEVAEKLWETAGTLQTDPVAVSHGTRTQTKLARSIYIFITNPAFFCQL